MKTIKLILTSSVFALSMMTAAPPARAADSCDLNGVPQPVGLGIDTLFCGTSAFGLPLADRQTLIGQQASIGGLDATAVGSYSVAASGNMVGVGIFPTGFAATALGSYAIGVGPGAVAIGDQAIVGIVSFPIPGFIQISAVANGTAIGSHSLVTAASGTAVGFNAEATATNSVAIGANSVADQANTVSVGTVGGERRIVNVAAGTATTDAVNFGQLAATNSAITAIQAVNTTQTTQINTLTTGLAATNTALTSETNARLAGDALLGDRLDDLSFDLRRNGREARAGTSAALAAAALPQAMDAGRSMIAAGVGTYRGRAAIALGASHRMSSGNAVMKVGVTYDTTEHVGANAGVGFQF